MRFLGLHDDSKTVDSAAMKKEELSHDEDEDILGAEEAKHVRSLAAMLNFMRCAMRGEGGVQEHGASDAGKLERSQESWEAIGRGPRGDVDDPRMASVGVVSLDVHVDLEWAKGPERESTGRGVIMMMIMM